MRDRFLYKKIILAANLIGFMIGVAPTILVSEEEDERGKGTCL